MRWVPSAPRSPGRCVFIPFIGGHHPEGFFDPGADMSTIDGRPYVSVVAAKQMAAMLGWAPATGVNPLAAKVNELEGEVARLEAKVEAAERFRESADHVMAELGKPRIPARKPGRPKAKVAA